MTGFDGNNFTEFAKGDFARIAKLCQNIDNLIKTRQIERKKV
jgi:putative transposase